MYYRSIVVIFIMVVSGYSIGYQHCTFRSQSTQGAPWQGSVNITNEKFDITVYRDYLDVQLEWELGADGVKPQEYSDALEIVGNLNLEQGSVIVGMLLWYKGEILKAKLKNKHIAREQYEEVVDRDAEIPPPPRDPVLLEYGWGPDNYYLSVFPVVWNQTRKVRIRYLIPKGNRGIPEYFGYPCPFTNSATVILRKSDEISSLATLSSNMTEKEVEGDSIVFSTGASEARYGDKSYSFIVADNNNMGNYSTVMNVSRYTLGEYEGELATVSNFAVGKLLNILKADLPVNEENELDGDLEVYALLSNGTEVCSTGVATDFIANMDNLNDSLFWQKTIAIFSTKPVQRAIEWHVYFNGDLLQTIIELPDGDEVENRETACIAALSGNIIALDTKLPNSFAAAFGYVDTVFTLLALEEDTISEEEAERYEESGVPLLEKEDIFAADEDLTNGIATKQFIENEYNIPLEVKYHQSEIDLFAGLVMRVSNGVLYLSFENALPTESGTMEVLIMSLSGRLLKKELVSMVTAGRELKIGLNGIYAQTVVVRVKIGKRQYVKTVNVSTRSF